jgi:hypothetical protein
MNTELHTIFVDLQCLIYRVTISHHIFLMQWLAGIVDALYPDRETIELQVQIHAAPWSSTFACLDVVFFISFDYVQDGIRVTIKLQENMMFENPDMYVL